MSHVPKGVKFFHACRVMAPRVNLEEVLMCHTHPPASHCYYTTDMLTYISCRVDPFQPDVGDMGVCHMHGGAHCVQKMPSHLLFLSLIN